MKKSDLPPFAAMDNTPRPEHERSNTGCYIPAADSRSSTTYNETYVAAIQTALEDVDYLAKKYSNRNEPISTSDESANTRGAISATQLGYDITFSSANSEGFNVSSSPEVSRGFNTFCSPLNHSAFYSTEMVSSVPIHNRQEGVSNNKMMTIINPDHIRSNLKICGKSGQHASTDSEQDMNKDNRLEVKAKSQVTFDNETLAGFHQPNAESFYNISQISPNDKASGIISDSLASKRESISSVEYNSEVPGSSGFHRNNTSNLSKKASQSFTCRVCKKEISKHVNQKNNFECCDCVLTYCEEVDLQIHSYIHVSKITCKICGKEHAEGNSHVSEHPCSLCSKSFQCRTQLYEHVLVHRDQYRKQCWVCTRMFYDHKSKEESSYVCCVCGHKSKLLKHFKVHNVLHFPRFFCKLCEEEYSTEEKCFHGSEFKCFDCPKKFECQTQLERHHLAYHECSSENCRICKRNVNEHFIRPEGKEFQCCNKECLHKFTSKSTLENHISSHLREFKCRNCLRRFNTIHSLNSHTPSCKSLLFICEICEKRFHSSDILRAHHLVNHRQA